MKNTILKRLIEADNMEFAQREKAIDFYNNDFETYIKAQFQNVDRVPIAFTGLTKKIIDKKSLVYKNAPYRYFAEETNDIKPKTDKYNEITSKKRSPLKATERMARLLPFVALRPLWKADKEKFDYQVIRSYKVIPSESDPTQPETFMFPILNNGVEAIL